LKGVVQSSPMTEYQFVCVSVQNMLRPLEVDTTLSILSVHDIHQLHWMEDVDDIR
jgi:hypothetical protein